MRLAQLVKITSKCLGVMGSSLLSLSGGWSNRQTKRFVRGFQTQLSCSIKWLSSRYGTYKGKELGSTNRKKLKNIIMKICPSAEYWFVNYRGVIGLFLWARKLPLFDNKTIVPFMKISRVEIKILRQLLNIKVSRFYSFLLVIDVSVLWMTINLNFYCCLRWKSYNFISDFSLVLNQSLWWIKRATVKRRLTKNYDCENLLKVFLVFFPFQTQEGFWLFM